MRVQTKRTNKQTSGEGKKDHNVLQSPSKMYKGRSQDFSW